MFKKGTVSEIVVKTYHVGCITSGCVSKMSVNGLSGEKAEEYFRHFGWYQWEGWWCCSKCESVHSEITK